ncbi:MAG: ribonuclease R, partial [Candidatus Thioglobus sp.]
MSDPHQKREADKYENPIPSREYIIDKIKGKPLSFYDLVDELELDGKQKKPLTHRLKAMVRDCQLSMDREGLYQVFDEQKDIMTGIINANPKGFGFVILDEGGDDLRLSAYQMKQAFHGDRVKARIIDQRGDSEIVEVLEGLKTVVGRLHIGDSESWI